MSYHRSLGATGVPTVADLQRQINRFFVQVPVTGKLDLATARAAIQLMIDRYQAALEREPSDTVTLAMLREQQARMATPQAAVLRDLANIHQTIRDYADFLGRPGIARVMTASHQTVAVALLAIAGLVFATRKKSRR